MNIIDEFIKIHGNKYDYSAVDYKNKKTKVIIICPKHGEFRQIPKNHLNGAGCMKCRYEEMRKKFTVPIEERIKQFNGVHNNKYDYSLIKCNYNKDSKVPIICPIHGTFGQTIGSHLSGHGCPECSRERENPYKDEDFVTSAIEVHGNKYDYSAVDYVNNKSKVTIICPEHGKFEQIPNSHLNGRGCPLCPAIISSGHQEIIDLFANYDVSINNRELIYPYELDIYIKSLNLAVEYNGNYWHSFDHIESTDQRNKHKKKHILCRDRGIDLVQIFEYDWVESRDIIKSIINHKLGKSEVIYARDCEIIELNNKLSSGFMNENHLYGHKHSTIIYGLTHNGTTYSVMSFSKNKKYGWEVNRFAHHTGHSVVGGASRLFKHFCREINPLSVLSFADARFGTGLLYKKLNFKFVCHTRPNYKYFKSNRTYSRQMFQKHKLEEKLEHFDLLLSEAQNVFNNGYRRIWDSGHYKFLWTRT